MEKMPTLQDFEYMEYEFEVSKILVQAGYLMDEAAFQITWGQIAEEVAHNLADHGIGLDQVGEEKVLEMVIESADVLKNEDVLFWRDSVRTIVVEEITRKFI
jgi:hypothetical protein